VEIMASTDPEVAYLETEYKQIRPPLIMFFRRKGCRHDSEDLADKTIYRCFLNLAKGREIDQVENIPKYIYGIANLVLKEYWREHTFVALGNGLSLGARNPEQEILDKESQEAQDKCLARCLSELAEDSRKLFLDYVFVEGPDKHDERKQLAAGHGLTLRALRIKISRLRDLLKKCGSQCLKELQYHTLDGGGRNMSPA
jgi:DNA-directed RNA polymerase specialized sigma24 family protein